MHILLPYARELIVLVSGFWAHRQRVTPSRTSCAPERSSGQARDLSQLHRCSSGSPRTSRSSTKEPCISGKALTSFMRSVYCYPKALRLAHCRFRRYAPAGTPGRPHRPLQTCLYPHPESRGCRGKPVREVLYRHQHTTGLEGHRDFVRGDPQGDGKDRRSSTVEHLHACYLDQVCVALLKTLASHVYALCRIPQVYFGASQSVQAERAKALGWNPRPVVLEDWLAEGVKTVF